MRGKINREDEGEVLIRVSRDEGEVVITISDPAFLVTLSPEDAKGLANRLLRHGAAIQAARRGQECCGE